MCGNMIEPVKRCLEDVDIVLIDEVDVREVEHWLAACQHCAENATLALEYVLDAVTGCQPEATEYMMCRPARCPSCSGYVTEKTLVAV